MGFAVSFGSAGGMIRKRRLTMWSAVFTSLLQRRCAKNELWAKAGEQGRRRNFAFPPELRRPALDIFAGIGYNPTRIQRGKGRVVVTALQREPPVGGRGRGPGGEYPLELAPQRHFGSVGVLRVRPLSRRRVLARPEAALREEAANQRWYREACSPSVPCRDGGVFYARSKECVAV